MNVYERPDHMESIYDNDRRNRPPQSACEPGYNIPAEAFACLPPSFVAQPFLKVNKDGDLELRDALSTSQKAFKPSSSRQCNGACKKGPASAILDAADQMFNRPIGTSRMAASNQLPAQKSLNMAATPRERAVECAIEQMRSGRQPWAATSQATRQLYDIAGCEQCELVISCNEGCCGARAKSSCGSAFNPRESIRQLQSARSDQVPVLQMPYMDTAEYADGNEHLVSSLPQYFQKPISQLDAAGSNNPFLSAFSKHALQSEKQKQISAYGLGVPPFPKPCPPTPIGVAPRYDAVPEDTWQREPLVITQQALLASDNCGCNRGRACSDKFQGTTCAPGTKRPTSIASIYARQGR